jgi:Ca2+-binding EF-hand superfamily protein
MNSTPLSSQQPTRLFFSHPHANGGKGVRPHEKPADARPAETRSVPQEPAEPLDSQILRPADWMTLEGLNAQFGQTDSLYDLDQDGVVGTSDMFALLQYQADPDRFADAPQVQTPEGTAFMTMTDLLANYGRSDSPFDLDRDGTVGTGDLFALQQILAAPAPVESADADTAAPVVQPGMTLEGLMAAYGSDNAAYDLDGSGAVDYNDMFTFLQNFPDSENAPPAPEPNPTLEGLLASFGQGHPTYDIDSNGTVDVADMFAFLQGQAAQVAHSNQVHPPRGPEFKPEGSHEHKPKQTPEARPTVENRVRTVTGGAGSTVEAKPTGGPTVQEVVDKILAQLKEAGFGSVPPTNLHGLLDKLDFAPKFEQAVLQQLSAYYENGLGVDRTA